MAKRNEPKQPKVCYSTRTVAEMLDVSQDWVRKQVNDGKLPGYRLGSGVMVCAKGLEAYLRNCKV